MYFQSIGDLLVANLNIIALLSCLSMPQASVGPNHVRNFESTSSIVQQIFEEKLGGKAKDVYLGALANEAGLKQLLLGSHIGQVLRLLWAEQDKNRRLAFLQARAQEGYAIFMLELALHLNCENSEEALFWLVAGLIRLFQDAVSFEGENQQVLTDASAIAAVYCKCIDASNRFSIPQAIAAKKNASRFLRVSATFPSPTWLLATSGNSNSLEPPMVMLFIREGVIELFPLQAVGFDPAAEQRVCADCGRCELQMQKCGSCKQVYYCNQQCQITDWRKHKQVCKPTQGGQ